MKDAVFQLSIEDLADIIALEFDRDRRSIWPREAQFGKAQRGRKKLPTFAELIAQGKVPKGSLRPQDPTPKCCVAMGNFAQGLCPAAPYARGTCRSCPESLALFGPVEKVAGADRVEGDRADAVPLKKKRARLSLTLRLQKRTPFVVGRPWICRHSDYLLILLSIIILLSESGLLKKIFVLFGGAA